MLMSNYPIEKAIYL